MNDLHCTLARQRLEDWLDGYLSVTDAQAMEQHFDACRECAAQRAAAEALRRELRALPLPEPTPGFADRALAEAARRNAVFPKDVQRELPGVRRWLAAPWRHVELWAGAAIGAAATALLMAALLGVPQRDQQPATATPADVSLALHEVREIGVAIDVDTALAGAIMTVLLEGGIDLVGFGEQREISWQTDLDAGTNMLSLPVIANSLEDGRLTALLSHGAISRRVDLSVRIAPPVPE